MNRTIAGVVVVLFALPAWARAADDKPPREEWGAPSVQVSRDETGWRIDGRRQHVMLDARDHTIRIESGTAVWRIASPGQHDLVVKRPGGGDEAALDLRAARDIKVEPYDTGYKTGVKLVLGDWERSPGLRLFLTIALEGADEDLVFDVAADEGGGTVIRRLDWPSAMDPACFEYTVLPNVRGVLLPKDWPQEYYPIRSSGPDGKLKASDTSEVQSNVIECWSMSWWGFQQGESAMMTIVETPDDAAYQFRHPAGGPTVIGPRWRGSLGALRYPRTCRMIFIPQGSYVDMAKRYRRYAMESGLFVSLKEKAAARPAVAELVGTPLVRLGILTNIVKDSLRYSTTQPERNHRVVTFDERAAQLRKWKQGGLDKLCVVLTGWPHLGYDRQHPDELPPATEAGGWEGMKRLQDTCREIGYTFALHDQYRDYYTDAPSFDEQFAVHEEDDEKTPSTAFPGTRFGQWKEGHVPYMNNWDGGKMAYLNNRFMPGHVRKNYAGLFAHGIHPQGVYFDVFGYVPPDEDFNPEHPCTRSDAIAARTACYHWAKANVGLIGTEAACDWTVRHSDFSSPLSQTKGIPVPLFNLVYHDAIMTPYAPDDLRGFLNAGLPQMSVGRGGNATESSPFTPEYLARARQMSALHKRLAMAEMTRHEFLDSARKKERTTFSDGTTVTVDWDQKSVAIDPPLKPD